MPHADKCYRLWTLARFLDADGTGRVTLERLQREIKRRSWRGLGGRSFRRAVRAGEGTFWTACQFSDGSGLLLHGLLRVCEVLGVRKLQRQPVLVKVIRGKTLKTWRAVLYTSYFPHGEFSSPISRATLEKLTGRERHTLLGYERAMGKKVQKQRNQVLTTKPFERGDPIPDGHHPEIVKGQIVLVQYIPSSYKMRYKQAARGMCNRVNEQLRGNSLIVADREQTKRFYYEDAHAATKRRQDLVDFDSYCYRGAQLNGKTVKRSRSKAALWTREEKISGQLINSTGAFLLAV